MIANHYPLAFASRWNWLIFGARPGDRRRHPALLQHPPQGPALALVDLGRGGGRDGPGHAPERRRTLHVRGGRGRAGRARDLRPGGGGGARPVQHVPHAPSRSGRVSSCRPRALCSTRLSGSTPTPHEYRATGGPHPRHATRQHHRDHARGAGHPGGVGGERRKDGVRRTEKPLAGQPSCSEPVVSRLLGRR